MASPVQQQGQDGGQVKVGAGGQTSASARAAPDRQCRDEGRQPALGSGVRRRVEVGAQEQTSSGRRSDRCPPSVLARQMAWIGQGERISRTAGARVRRDVSKVASGIAASVVGRNRGGVGGVIAFAQRLFQPGHVGQIGQVGDRGKAGQKARRMRRRTAS